MPEYQCHATRFRYTAWLLAFGRPLLIRPAPGSYTSAADARAAVRDICATTLLRRLFFPDARLSRSAVTLLASLMPYRHYRDDYGRRLYIYRQMGHIVRYRASLKRYVMKGVIGAMLYHGHSTGTTRYFLNALTRQLAHSVIHISLAAMRFCNIYFSFLAVGPYTFILLLLRGFRSARG